MAKRKLLASSGTIEGIQKLVNQYWFANRYTIDPATLAIQHPDKVIQGYTVSLVRGRYRFEMDLPSA